jgi:hypothetical protein
LLQRTRHKTAPAADWARRFEPAIPIQNRKSLFTLRDAATYVTELPKAEQNAPRWRTAIELLMFAAEKGAPTMMARIAVMKALHHREAPTEFPAHRRRARKYTLIR